MPRSRRRPATPSRRQSREAAFQLLFAMRQGASADRAALVVAMNQAEEQGALPQDEFSSRLLDLAEEHADAIDAVVAAVVKGWTADRLAAADRALLALGIAEILWMDDIDPAVTINEYIELAKEYGEDNSPKFLNGVLDRVRRDAPSLRPPAGDGA